MLDLDIHEDTNGICFCFLFCNVYQASLSL